MNLAAAFGVVIVVALGMIVAAMYVGGGVMAVRRQLGTLVLMTAALVAIAVLMLVLRM